MKKTISEIESIIEDRIAELEEEYELDIYDRNVIREEEYQKGGWKHDPFPEELEEEEKLAAAARAQAAASKPPVYSRKLAAQAQKNASMAIFLGKQYLGQSDQGGIVIEKDIRQEDALSASLKKIAEGLDSDD